MLLVKTRIQILLLNSCSLEDGKVAPLHRCSAVTRIFITAAPSSAPVLRAHSVELHTKQINYFGSSS